MRYAIEMYFDKETEEKIMRKNHALGAKDRRRGTEHEVSGMENKAARYVGGLQ